jgi:hypothetical protein
MSCSFFCRRGELVAAGAAANHPRRYGSIRLGAEVGRAVAAGVNCGSPRRNFFCKRKGMVAAGAAANHPRRYGSTRLGAEVGRAVAAGVNCGSPCRGFSVGAGIW